MPEDSCHKENTSVHQFNIFLTKALLMQMVSPARQMRLHSTEQNMVKFDLKLYFHCYFRVAFLAFLLPLASGKLSIHHFQYNSDCMSVLNALSIVYVSFFHFNYEIIVSFSFVCSNFRKVTFLKAETIAPF